MYTKNKKIVAEGHVSDPIEVRSIPEGVHKALVSYDRERTINTGNFENTKIRIGITLPCVLEEAQSAYSTAVKFVTERLEQEVEEVER